MTDLILNPTLATATPMLLAGTAFGAVALVGFTVSQVIFSDEKQTLRDRLKKADGGGLRPEIQKPTRSPLKQLGRKLAAPFSSEDGKKMLDLRAKLIRGGIYSTSAPQIFHACCFGGIIVGGLLGFLLGSATGVGGFAGAAVLGLVLFMAPRLWLSMQEKKNQKALDQGLPDALDLMVVCVEAGLTVDAAMQRVGEELAGAHPEMAREFGIAHMETRIGLSRAESFKNLGRRTGNGALQSFSAMLGQAERFGTSIAQALQVQAAGLRQDRSLRAEEKAAKNMVKLNIPLVLFIFPGTLIVLMGPIVIKFMFSGDIGI